MKRQHPAFHPDHITKSNTSARSNCCVQSLILDSCSLIPPFGLTPLPSALSPNTPITPLQSALTNSLDLKSFTIRTYAKTGGTRPIRLTTFPDPTLRLDSNQPLTPAPQGPNFLSHETSTPLYHQIRISPASSPEAPDPHGRPHTTRPSRTTWRRGSRPPGSPALLRRAGQNPCLAL